MKREEIAANGITTVFCLVVRGTSPFEFLCPPNRWHEITSSEEERAEVFVREVDALEMKRRAEHLTGFRFEIIRRPTLVGGEALGYCPTCGHTGGHNSFCGTLRESTAMKGGWCVCDKCGRRKLSTDLDGVKHDGRMTGLYGPVGEPCGGTFRLEADRRPSSEKLASAINDRVWAEAANADPKAAYRCDRCGHEIGGAGRDVEGMECRTVGWDTQGKAVLCLGHYRLAEPVRFKDGRELPITVTELAAGMATATYREETRIAPDEHLPSAWHLNGGSE